MTFVFPCGCTFEYTCPTCEATIAAVDKRLAEMQMIANEPGCMRAMTWSRCHGCRRRIDVGDVVRLTRRDGRRWWLCAPCSLRPEQ